MIGAQSKTKEQDYKITYNLHGVITEMSVKGIEHLQERIRDLQGIYGVGEMNFQVAGWVPCNNRGEIIWNGRYENLTEEGRI